MRLSLKWLADHVDLQDLSADAVGEILTLHTAEVSEVRRIGGDFRGMSAARVLDVRPHPNADRLRLARLETAKGEVEVVCGAPNIAKGRMVCFAPAGTRLPDGLLLERRKIRGVESAGMALSERELGLGDDHSGIVLLEESVAVGTPLERIFAGDASLDVENTAITARPDLWGHYGIARELAAVLDRPLRPLELGDAPVAWSGEGPAVEVSVDAPDLCPRYAAWAFENLAVAPSPDWLRRRLEAAGQRSINNLVDLTNYVMLECGQPLHAFDRRQIAGGRIVVRSSRKGETVRTLDGAERTLPEGCCVIADPERAVAIAGVMGLENSEVASDTTAIVLEIANFEMTSIRSTSRDLGLRTESATRFEKGLDPELVPVAAQRFYRLLKEVCPRARAIGGARDIRAAPAAQKPTIVFGKGWIARRLGTEVSAPQVDAVLKRLGFTVRREGDEVFVDVPSWRAGRDVSLPEDLVEEVGRIVGYDKIEPRPLVGPLVPVPEEPARAARRRARVLLSGPLGLSELYLSPFTTAAACARAAVGEGTIAVRNAEQAGFDLLEPSLLPNLLGAVAQNLKHRGEVAVYTVAPVFSAAPDGGETLQPERLAIALARRDGEDSVREMKGIYESLLGEFRIAGARFVQETGPAWLHPGRAARATRGREDFGWFGSLNPSIARAFEIDAGVAVADLDFEALWRARPAAEKMSLVSRYPEVPYDVAVVVDRRTPAAEVHAALERVDRELVRRIDLFDLYEGPPLPEGKKSLAYRIVFGSMGKTLDTEEVDRLRSRVEALVSERGWSLRR